MTLEEFVSFVRVNQQNRNFFHFTDIRNLPSIRQHGLLSMRELRRRNIVVPAPGGNQWSLDQDIANGVDRYVHLGFFSSHPMEWKARQDGRIEETKFLTIDPSVLLRPGAMVTNDVANAVGVVATPPLETLEHLDLEVIYTRTDWANTTVKERLKVAKRYELLIPDGIPTDYIRNLGHG